MAFPDYSAPGVLAKELLTRPRYGAFLANNMLQDTRQADALASGQYGEALNPAELWRMFRHSGTKALDGLTGNQLSMEQLSQTGAGTLAAGGGLALLAGLAAARGNTSDESEEQQKLKKAASDLTLLGLLKLAAPVPAPAPKPTPAPAPALKPAPTPAVNRIAAPATLLRATRGLGSLPAPPATLNWRAIIGADVAGARG